MLEVYSETGKLMIRSDMFPWFLRRTGTGTSQAKVAGNTTPSSILVPKAGVSYTTPMVALSVGGDQAAAPLGSYEDNWHFVCSGPVGTTFTYYVYDRITNSQASSFGLELRDSANQLVFSSNYRPAQILSMLGSPADSGFTPSGFYNDAITVTFSGKTLAFSCCGFSGHNRSGPAGATHCNGLAVIEDGTDPYCANWQGDNDGKLYGASVTGGGSTVTATSVSYDDVFGTYGPGLKSEVDTARNLTEWQIPAKIFVIDVTGVPIGQTFY